MGISVGYEAIYKEAGEQRNKANDDLAIMTAYAKTLETRLADLEKPGDEPVGRHRKT